ncbi:DUF3592 domain-containing protein [Amycolatopsis sp. H20-H5]|uniref:DUF3592 domain-containing protein n=1 Tax=Amycolatopsis sp. H20-H5 TaxID=3046309 RepID=UPI002DBE2895|nr:DUF3592 domain-containing protein [Amycolatopsis sp. H20-H5]MEC3980046.1 DUF3592 domain-containing protein [Amycolatopsis sp. H20-H5]
MSEFRPIRFWRLRSDDVVSGPDPKVDLDLFARLPSRLVSRNLVLILLCLLGIGGASALSARLDEQAGELLRIGTRVPGTVVDVHKPSKSDWYIEVRYRASGVERTADVTLDTYDGGYRTGDPVVVVYDPADPARLRTDRERNEPGFPNLVVGGSILLFLLALPFLTLAVVNWRRRRVAIRRAGWRRGVARTDRWNKREPVEIRVRFDTGDDASFVALRTTMAAVPRKLVKASKLRVWVGGDGRALVVVFVRARVLIPVKPERQPKSPPR